MSDLRTPLARAKGLGSAKDGTHHFLVQRITAVALIPLTIWFCLSLASIPGSTYADMVTWLNSPWTAAMVVAFLLSGFYHGAMGIQVILEDYISDNDIRTGAIVGVQILSFFFAALAVVSVIKISLGGA